MSQSVVTVGPEASANELLRLFMAHSIHHLPVVEERRVVGMLSWADIMKLEFFLPRSGCTVRGIALQDQWRAKILMRSPVVTVTEHESVQRAAESMTTNGIHALPVVDSAGELVGIITTTDIMHGCFSSRLDMPDTDSGDARRFPLSEIRIAKVLASARRSVNIGHDPHGIAATLLAIQQRMRALEEVVSTVKRYLNAGQDEQLHAAVTTAIERADRLDEKMRQGAMPGLGIDG